MGRGVVLWGARHPQQNGNFEVAAMGCSPAAPAPRTESCSWKFMMRWRGDHLPRRRGDRREI